jgi:hypothetical protein
MVGNHAIERIVGTCEVMELHDGEVITNRCLEEFRKRRWAPDEISKLISMRFRKMCT